MTSSIFKQYATDKAAEKTGVWIDYGDIKFLVSRAGGANSAFADAYKAKTRPHRYQLDKGTLAKADDDRIMAELYAESVIKSVEVMDEGGNWIKGVPTADGKVLPYSVTAVRELLLELPDMFVDLRAQATDLSKFLKQEEEADLKNS